MRVHRIYWRGRWRDKEEAAVLLRTDSRQRMIVKTVFLSRSHWMLLEINRPCNNLILSYKSLLKEYKMHVGS